MRYFLLLISALLITSCKPETKTTSAQQIIDNSIEFSNLNKVKKATVSFDFRKNSYSAQRNNGDFRLTKTVKNDLLVVKDVLSNNNFQRFVNDSLVTLSKKKEDSYRNSVNSVHYFSVLPLGLNDKAVHKKLLEPVTIKGKEYHKIQVTFSEDGGGDDFDDVFIYWFAKDTFQLDYLAYKYHTNGGGIRFRDVKEEKRVNGIRFVDYNNYKPSSYEIDFFTIDKLYQEDKLKKISEIVLDNINVTPFD